MANNKNLCKNTLKNRTTVEIDILSVSTTANVYRKFSVKLFYIYK